MVDVEPRPPASERVRVLDGERHALAVDRALRQRSQLWPTLMLLIAVGLATAIPLVLVSRGHIAESSLEWLMPTSMLSTFFIGLGLALAWQGRTPKVARPPAAVSEAIARPAAIERELRRVRLARLGEARLMATRVRSPAGVLDLVLGASLLLPATVVAAWFSYAMATGREAYDPLLFVLWLGCPLGFALIVGFRVHRRARRRKIAAALERAGVSFAARRLPSHDHVVAWLNDVWAAPSASEDLYQGAEHAALAGRARGYPVLVDVELEGYSDGEVEIPPRVLVHVAALAAEPPPGWQELRAAVACAGFELTFVAETGLLARGLPVSIDGMRREPERLAELGSIAQRLAAFLEACGALPAPSARELGAGD